MELPQDYTSVIRLLYDAFRRHDEATCLALFSDRAEWTAAENFLYGDESPYLGPEAIRHLIFGRLPADWDDFTLTASEIIGGADVVIASGRFKGTFRANRAPIDAQFVQVFHFSDGKITKCQMYTDTAQFKEAIGALRSPSATASNP
jgi:ketosteroid isomerase-like protein